MFGIGSTELLVILVVALIVLGPKSLASVSRSLGKVIGEFRRVSTDFQRSLNVEAAREEMKAAEAKRQATQEGKTSQPESAQQASSGQNVAGPPPDSPLGQAIAKAQQEAQRSAANPFATASGADQDKQHLQRDAAHG